MHYSAIVRNVSHNKIDLSKLSQDALKKTVRLPMTAMPLNLPMGSEAERLKRKWLARCTDELYTWQRGREQDGEKKKNKVFVLHDGPPYANGKLHIGHALNKILKDITNRIRVHRGDKVNYIPGWDCHGLPIEAKALEKLLLSKQGQRSKVLAPEGMGRTVKPVAKADNGDLAAAAIDMGKELDPEEIRRIAKELASEAVIQQMEGFKEWAVMGDYENRWTTMDKDYEIRQLGIFLEMLKKGLIYRSYRPVYWSSSSGTALAEAELEYKDSHKSTAAFVKFPIVHVSTELEESLKLDFESHPLYAVIWTTTPWTIPANKAIAINTELDYTIVETERHGRLLVARERLEDVLEDFSDEAPRWLTERIPGQALVGTLYVHPLFAESIPPQPILPGSFVEAHSGTGLVHCAPGHGMEDYSLCVKHGIEPFSPVDEAGKFTQEAYPLDAKILCGLDVLTDGTKKVLELLEKQGLLLGLQDYEHRYPYDWRTKRPVIVRATAQWFANIQRIKGSAIESLENVTFIPETGKKRLSSMVESRNEWCISRQRAWGVPIPAMYHKHSGQPLMADDSVRHIIRIFEEKGVDSWWDRSLPEDLWVPGNYKVDGPWVRGQETMDVWFDSGSSWATLKDLLGKLGIERGVNDTPFVDLYVEGTDQHRGWFQSSLLTKHAAAPNGMKTHAPFGMILTHGFILDEAGRKMSKSLGNVIDPIDIIKGKFKASVTNNKNSSSKDSQPSKNDRRVSEPGIDLLRLWVASSDYTKDVTVGESVLKSVSESLRRFRITARFLLGNLHNWDGTIIPYEEMSPIDQYALAKLYDVCALSSEAFTVMEFRKVVDTLSSYSTNELSAGYLNISKDILYCDEPTSHRRRAIQTVLFYILRAYLAFLSPLTPLLAEEIWEYTPNLLRARLAQHPAPEPGDRRYSLNPNLQDIDSPCKLSSFQAPQQWNEKMLKHEFDALTEMRNLVNKLLEEIKTKKVALGGKLDIKTPLETDITLYAYSNTSLTYKLLKRYEECLSHVLIASKVKVVPQALSILMKTDGLQQDYTLSLTGTMETLGEGPEMGQVDILVEKASGFKCPRCWMWVSEKEGCLCKRCMKAVERGLRDGEIEHALN